MTKPPTTHIRHEPRNDWHGDAHRRALHTAEVAAKALHEGSHLNVKGHKIQESHTIPEMQEQSEL